LQGDYKGLTALFCVLLLTNQPKPAARRAFKQQHAATNT
jgi:hypothetical protein